MRIEKCLAIPAKRSLLPLLEFMNLNSLQKIILPFELRKDRSALSDKPESPVEHISWYCGYRFWYIFYQPCI